MIPDSWASFIAFVFTISPGILFDRIVAYRQGSFRESAFKEIGRIILSSLAAGALAISFLLGLQALWPAFGASLEEIVLKPTKTLEADFGGVCLTVIILLIASMGFAVGGAFLMPGGNTRFSRAQPWHLGLSPERKGKEKPIVLLKMRDGTLLEGHATAWTNDLESERRTLVLAPPLYSWNGPTRKDIPLRFQRIVVNEDEFIWMRVQFWSEELFNERRSLQGGPPSGASVGPGTASAAPPSISPPSQSPAAGGPSPLPHP